MPSIKGRYARIEIPLNKAENGKELFITGDYLSIVSITGNGTCEIKLDHRHSQTIDLREISSITGNYERVYFTTDGAGGICTMFVGNGMAIHVSPDPEKIQSGGTVGRQLTTSTTIVQRLSETGLKVRNLHILNSNGIYACYAGAYVANAATFKNYAYLLLPHQLLKFDMVDLSALGCIAYDSTYNITLSILGTYE
jgi:hypothetical protein